jgi:hypothetical protein
MKDEELENFLAARNAALMTLNLEWARAVTPGLGDDVLLVGMHKTRYDCTAIPDALRLESAEWLRKRGYRAIGGVPLAAPGELP